MALPTIAICTDASKNVLNAILTPANEFLFTVALVPSIPTPDYDTPVTHWAVSAMSASLEGSAALSLMGVGDGTVPILPEGYEYGVDGMPTEEEVQAAIGSTNLQVWTSSEATTTEGLLAFHQLIRSAVDLVFKPEVV